MDSHCANDSGYFKQMKRILYISSVVSEDTLTILLKKAPLFNGLAAQKFNRLVAEGFAKNNCIVTALSPMLINKRNHYREEKNGVVYKYVYAPNVLFLKQLVRLFYVFFYTLFWGVGRKKDKAVVCDVLNISSSIAALFACSINGL